MEEIKKGIWLTKEGTIQHRKKYWLSYLVAEEQLFDMIEKSGHGEAEFIHFQRKRMRTSLMASLVSLIPVLWLHNWYFAFTGVLFFGYQWREMLKRQKIQLHDEQVEKNTNWHFFERQIINYLIGFSSVYGAFNEFYQNLVDGPFKDALDRLMIDMVNTPKSIQPWISFAKEAGGGTDQAYTFMTSLYNFQRNTKDPSVINSLSETAKSSMKRGIKDILKMNRSHFMLYTTYLTMLNAFPLFGYAVGYAYHIFMRNLN